MSTNVGSFLLRIQESPELQQELAAISTLPYEERESALATLSDKVEAPISIADLKSFEQKHTLEDVLLEGISGGAPLMGGLFNKIGEGVVTGLKITWEACLDIYRN